MENCFKCVFRVHRISMEQRFRCVFRGISDVSCKCLSDLVKAKNPVTVSKMVFVGSKISNGTVKMVDGNTEGDFAEWQNSESDASVALIFEDIDFGKWTAVTDDNLQLPYVCKKYGME